MKISRRIDELCNNIENLRVNNSIKQSDLARRIGISQATYTNLLRNCDFRISHLRKMAEIFNVDIKCFFDRNIEQVEIKIYSNKAIHFILSKLYYAEFEVIDRLNQHKDGLNFNQWLEKNNLLNK